MSTYNKKSDSIVSKVLLTVFVFSCLIEPMLAEERVTTPSFVQAKRIQQGILEYPTSQRRSNNSGIVEMLLMIGTDGLVFEPMVTHSTKPQFEKAALNALADYRFSPALLDGEPVESIYELRVMFMMEEGKAAVSSKFSKRYEAARIELEKVPQDQQKIVKKIQELESSNNLSPYAYAHLNQARLEYASLFGNIKDQINVIESMLLFEGRTGLYGRFLDEGVRQSLRQKLFTLSVQKQLYGDAFHAYNRLQEIDPSAEKKYGATMDEMNTIRNSDKPVAVGLQIDSRQHTELYLFRRTFYLSAVQGELSGIKLRCRNKFKHLPLQIDSEYEIPKDWGYCNLQVIGSADTTFNLVQL